MFDKYLSVSVIKIFPCISGIVINGIFVEGVLPQITFLVLSVDSVGALSATTPLTKGKVEIGYFSIVPKTVPVSDQKEASYKGVVEEARRNIARKYKAAVDTTQSIHNYHGNIKVKVFMDDTGRVASCTIDDSSVKNTGVKRYTVSYIKDLDFGPVRDNPKVKGMIIRFSFYPLEESR